MQSMTFSRLKSILTLCAGILLLLACSPRQSGEPPKLVPFPGTPTAECLRAEIPPKITDVQPDEIKPRSVVTVIASGGFFQDNCGAYDESARLYKIYLDDEPIADLSCYVNHCEGKFVLPENTTAGVHCMGVQKGTCQVKFDVAAK